MTEQSPEEIHLKHIRAPDYKEISADGTLHKIVDNHLVITFYIEDSRVTGEVLRRDGQDPPTYRIAAIEEEKQRLDVVAVRVPTKATAGLARGRRRAADPAPPGANPAEEVVRRPRTPSRGRTCSHSAPRVRLEVYQDARAKAGLWKGHLGKVVEAPVEAQEQVPGMRQCQHHGACCACEGSDRC